MIETGNGKRDQMKIMVDLLSTLKEPRLATHVMYATNLSYRQLKKYLALLTNIGLTEEIRGEKNQRLFRITERGMFFIDVITKGGNSIDRYSEAVVD